MHVSFYVIVSCKQGNQLSDNAHKKNNNVLVKGMQLTHIESISFKRYYN